MPPKVTVTGNVTTPDGVGVESGRITYTISQPVVAGGDPVGGANQTVIVSGAVNFDIVPNSEATPGNSFYTVVYESLEPISRTWAEFWNVVGTDGQTIDIGNIQRLDKGTPNAPVVFPPAFSTVDIVPALPPPVESDLGKVVVLDTGSGQTFSYQLHRQADETLVWVLGGALLPPTNRFSSEANLPTPTVELFAVAVFVDSGSGETQAFVCHRDGNNQYRWVQQAHGGI